jgi:fatty-acyl-CoA synthase
MSSVRWNAGFGSVPGIAQEAMVQTIGSAVRWWAATMPDAMALSIGGQSISYRMLNEQLEGIAARLLSEGVEPGDRVALCAGNSIAYWASVLAVIRIGAIAAPLHARCTATELAERVADYAPRLVVADEEQAGHFNGVPVIAVDALAQARESRPLPYEGGPDSPVMIVMTSGSTARPKGVMLSHRSMTSFAMAWALEESGFSRGARIIGAGLHSTAAGSVKVLHYLVAGAAFFFEAEFVPERFLDLMVRERITTFTGVPIFFERLAALPGFAEADLSSLETATVGGAPVGRAVFEQWAARGVIIRQGYGQTECGGIVSLMPRHLAREFPSKCGRGGLFCEILVLDSGGRPCEPGEPGEIHVRAPSTMVGYWNDPAATEAVLRDGWVRTGDVGVQDEQGHLTFVSRLKDIIISGGLNISCAEVEQAIAEFPNIVEVSVFGVADDKFGETPMAIVHSGREVAVDALIEHCNRVLADYKVPRYVVVEPEPLPRLPIGKIAKTALREKYEKAAATLPRVR